MKGDARTFPGWFLVGPTASGKTAVAHLLALRLGADVLSADSMLVYRGMDIGTAKPDSAMLREVQYWGIDVLDPGESFSAGRFRELAFAAFQQTKEQGRSLIIAGGTGLYIKALTHGLDRAIAPNQEVRAHLNQLYKEQGLEGLQNALRARSEEAFIGLADPRNPRRLIRAIERLDSGVSENHKDWSAQDTKPAMPGLAYPAAVLHERIRLRVEQMYEQGLLDETRRLMASGRWPLQTAAQAIGYAEAAAVLRGDLSEDEARAITARVTRRLAKRQMTWFRRQAHVVWIEVDSAMKAEQIADLVQGAWNQNGPVPVCFD